MAVPWNRAILVSIAIGFLSLVYTHDGPKRILLENEPALDLGGRVDKLEEEMKALKRENEQLKQAFSQGSMYVRWGRTVCPATASVVYKGFIAGKRYNEQGDGTDSLCLPEDPTWAKYVDGVSVGGRAYIYGTEIDTYDTDHIFNHPVHNQDMPCVACQSTKSTTAMFPARNNCYPGWTEEYSGYLMAGFHNFHGYDHVCMDASPEFLQHGNTNDNEHTLFLVEGVCGSLPCPPYVDGRELACVVCSK